MHGMCHQSGGERCGREEAEGQKEGGSQMKDELGKTQGSMCCQVEQAEEANKWTAVLQSLHPRCEQRHDHRLMRASSSQYIAAGAVDLVRSEYLHVQAP